MGAGAELRAGKILWPWECLGAGLVEIPTVEPADPRSAVLANPVVAEGKRF
ncbi:hypothetical protein GV790_27510, partial [Nocardia cyriacigeorgica]|nr:hypothetical protein [Nocardia cyriacigeorgica]